MSNLPSNPSFAARAAGLLRLAGPLVLAQVAVIGMSVTDIYFVGQLGADELAAVQLGGSLWTGVVMVIIGVMTGNSPIVGQYFGAGKVDEVRRQFQQVLWLSLPLGLFAALLVGAGVHVLGFLDISETVRHTAQSYLRPFVATAMLLSIFFACRTTFEGVGDTRPVLIFNLLGLLLNGLFDYLLVFGRWGMPALGGVGAAWASLGVMVFQLLGMLLYGRYSVVLRQLHLFRDFARPHLASLANTLRIGLPIAAAIIAEFSFFGVIPLLIAHLGSQVVGAHAIAVNVDAIAFMVPLGISQALTIRVSHSVGAGDYLAARRVAITGYQLVMLMALVMAAVKLIFRHDLAALFSPDPGIREIAATMFMWAALLGVVDCLQIAASGALRGYKDARAPLLLQLLAFWVIAFPVAYSLSLTDFWGEPWGVYGFWFGMVLAVSCASLMLIPRWHWLSSRFIARAEAARD